METCWPFEVYLVLIILVLGKYRGRCFKSVLESESHKEILTSVFESQTGGHKENIQIGPDKDISLKAKGVVCSGLSWKSLETIPLGEYISDA